MIALLLATALSAEFRVTREGDTIEQIAEQTGEEASEIRTLNELGDNEQPYTGQLLTLPEAEGHSHQVGYLIALTGTATKRSATEPDGPARLGDELPAGTTVCTGASSYATVRLAADSSTGGHDDVTLLSETCVLIRGLATRPKSRSTTLNLESGSLSVRSASGEGELSVITRDGIATGRNGGFRVTLEDKASRTEALYAQIALIGNRVEREVPAGFGARVAQGEDPTGTTPLLPPGEPQAPGDGATLRRHDFDWTAIDRALGYRVEFSTAEDFSELVWVEEVDSERWRPDFISLPEPSVAWWWRVATFDRLGYLGIPSDGRELREPVSGVE